MIIKNSRRKSQIEIENESLQNENSSIKKKNLIYEESKNSKIGNSKLLKIKN